MPPPDRTRTIPEEADEAGQKLRNIHNTDTKIITGFLMKLIKRLLKYHKTK
jgi:hypothetical protein